MRAADGKLRMTDVIYKTWAGKTGKKVVSKQNAKQLQLAGKRKNNE
ncbi:MAG: hypothetical protein U5M23_13760 [Marinagarivorans sp.]|nr:hypothetical protein [Marinagarivorans sp.]